MDIEETLRAIAESQLRAEQRSNRADERMDRADEQIRATRDLVRMGIKMVLGLRTAHDETTYRLNALIHSQMRTDELMRQHDKENRKRDERFERLMQQLLRKNTNGHR